MTRVDRDIAPEGKNLIETNIQLDQIAEAAEKLQEKTGIQLLWATSQLFLHPRYMHGAATSQASTEKISLHHAPFLSCRSTSGCLCFRSSPGEERHGSGETPQGPGL